METTLEGLVERCVTFACASVVATFLTMPVSAADPNKRLLEKFPDSIAERLAQREAEAGQLPATFQGIDVQLVIIELARRWKQGQTVTVAFKSGDPALHGRIEQVASEWSRHTNLTFDFGLDENTQLYRTFSADDDEYAADIRIAFDSGGYWSAVGNDSVNRKIVPPWEQSMNLQNIDQLNEGDFTGTVLHEFGHALGAEHEHQHPTEGCDDEWMWDDDPGYVSTTDPDGYLVRDEYWRYPGIYTFMSGAPNYWSRKEVDFNLRQLKNSSAYDAGPFDKYSIMKYYFPSTFFRNGDSSKCYTGADATDLSAQDKVRISAIYPTNSKLLSDIEGERNTVAAKLMILQSEYANIQSLEGAIDFLSQ